MVVRAVEDIASGIGDLLLEHRVSLIGGNTTRIDGPAVLTATLIGSAPKERLLTRKGSRVGDALFVTGQLGDARAGLLAAQRGISAPELVRAQTEPKPRVHAGIALARLGRVHAACDVSDGLGRDARRLLTADGLGARIEFLPISPALRAVAPELGVDPARIAASGGEDYELLFTADAADEASIRAACGDTSVTRIGTVMQADFTLELHGNSEPLPAGYEHFRAP
jgi:thiamine-monophosphate kinase